VINEKLYFSKGIETLLQQITHGAIQVDKKKNCAICFDFPLD
jgi:hypothetical protein